MSHKITSEDNWLVQCLFLASFGALIFFGTSSGWLAAQLGMVQHTANAYTAVITPAPAAPVLAYDKEIKTKNEKSYRKDEAIIKSELKKESNRKDEADIKSELKKESRKDAVIAKTPASWVFTTDRINVRTTPNGKIVVIKNPRERGQVMAGAAVTEAGHTWQLVKFADGVKGYVAETYLETDDVATLRNQVTDTAQPIDTSGEVIRLQAQVTALQAQLEKMQAQINMLMQQ